MAFGAKEIEFLIVKAAEGDILFEAKTGEDPEYKLKVGSIESSEDGMTNVGSLILKHMSTRTYISGVFAYDSGALEKLQATIDDAKTNPNQLIQSIKIKGQNLDFYGIPNILESPKKYTYKFKLNPKHISFFCLPDPFSYKKDTDKLTSYLLERLKKIPFEALLVGGVIPKSLKTSSLKFPYIHCPQIHPNQFEFAEIPTGIKFISINDTTRKISETDPIQISSLNMVYHHLDLNTLKAGDWDNTVKEIIKKDSKLNCLMRITLSGNISRTQYQKHLNLYRYHEIGRVKNFYFELDDDIEFKSQIKNLSDLRIRDELKEYIDLREKELLKEKKMAVAEIQAEREIYMHALKKIMQELD